MKAYAGLLAVSLLWSRCPAQTPGDTLPMSPPVKKTVIRSASAPEPIGAYSQAIRAGNLLFVSGQIALDPATGELITANIAVETKQVMRNIKAVLEEAGATMDHVVKATIFLKDLSQFQAVNEAYGSFFHGTFPARETVEVSRLPKDVNIEISVVAVVE